MRRFILSILLTMVLVVGLTNSAIAEVAKDNNAALRYLLAMGFMPEMTGNSSELAHVENIETFKKLSKELQDKVGVVNNYRIKNLLAFAAKCTYCNLAPDFQNLFGEDIVPPYRSLRTFARFLNAGAWKLISERNHLEGAKLIVATFRYGDDIEDHGPLIGYMVGLAIRKIALRSMKNFLAGDFEQETKNYIIDYLKSIPKPAFNPREGLQNELLSFKNMIIDIEKSPSIIAQLMHEDKTVVSTDSEKKNVAPENNPRLVAKAQSYYSSEQYKKDSKEIFEYFNAVLAIDSSVSENILKIKALRDDYASRGNLFVDNIVPDFFIIYKKQIELQKAIDELIK